MKHLKRAQNIQKEIHKILLKEWDPIGVSNVIEAQDEYDSYIPTIYKLLITKSPKHELSDYLFWLETEHMGLTGDKRTTEEITVKLLRLLN